MRAMKLAAVHAEATRAEDTDWLQIEALYRMLAWVQAGDIRYEETISPGLETAPAALAGLFEGRNLGKQLVQVCSSQSD